MASTWDGEDTLAGVIWILTSVGAVNWGLLEFLEFDLVAEIGTALGYGSIVATVVYGAIAVAGLITLADHMGMSDVPDVVDSIRGSGDD